MSLASKTVHTIIFPSRHKIFRDVLNTSFIARRPDECVFHETEQSIHESIIRPGPARPGQAKPRQTRPKQTTLSKVKLPSGFPLIDSVKQSFYTISPPQVAGGSRATDTL